MHNQNYHKIDAYIAIKKDILSQQSLFGIKVMSDSMKLHNHEIITKKKKFPKSKIPYDHTVLT